MHFGAMRTRVATTAGLVFTLLVAPLSVRANKNVGHPSAQTFRVVRAVLRMLKERGFETRRVQPHDKRALLKPWHDRLPKDPYYSSVTGNVVSVVKGKRRSKDLPGGANYALSSFLHEAGHAIHDHDFGRFHPRPTGEFIPFLEGHHPMRVAEKLVREIQANNTAIKLMVECGASSDQVSAYKRSRLESYRSKLSQDAVAREHPVYQEYRSVLCELRNSPGYSRTYALNHDLPEIFELAEELRQR